MKHVYNTVLAVTVAILTLGTAHAQFGGLLGGGSSGPSPESIISNYVQGAQMVMQAQIQLLEAINEKVQAAKAAASAGNMKEGATKQILEDSAKIQTENNKILEEKFKAKELVLDAQSKVLYAQGLGLLGTGVTKYIALVSTLKSFKPSATSLGSAAQGAVYVVQTLPTNVSTLQRTVSAAIDFGKSQGVPIPADASAALP